jgi:gluconate kinase
MTAAMNGWVPVRFFWHEEQPMLDWRRLDDRRFTEPFFDETISAALQRPFNLLFRRLTPINVLLEWQARSPGISPSGFIFHMSRCGSTLAAQMLAALPRNIVLSEADPIDSVLRATLHNPALPEADRLRWLRALVSALGQHRGSDETRLFIKFESWHIIELPQIRAAFPDVPWIFLYRDPVEVLVSQTRRRGRTMQPGPLTFRLLGLNLSDAERMDPDEYCARFLARICQAALEHHRDGGMLVSYRDLPRAVWSSIADFFRSPDLSPFASVMQEVARFDAKAPHLAFADDCADKQRRSTDSIRMAATRRLEPVYRQLEEQRMQAPQRNCGASP